MKFERYNCNGRFHEAIRHNDTLYLSGQVASHGQSVSEQAQEVLDNLSAILRKYGSDEDHILSATVYLADVSAFNEFNEVWDNWFKAGTQPIRTCLGATLAGSKYALEITLIAAVVE